ncbi:alpha-galactosidase [Novosphingobium subterraneum]|uniref:alpha-galactosidase n=1 Tax=Novosphingobium subterraneum TaxID=48936 RepID=A0A0B8ZQC7_9SPHN|nr:alpha-galactosidase [Novosphingobium subterraneum]KHS48399.1 glycoside hydrolase, clan GH-D [Novosphingobium subterraneum]
MSRTFALHTGTASLAWDTAEGRAPVWRHFGPTVETQGLPPLSDLRGPASYSLDHDVPFCSVPVSGLGWFGPAFLKVSSAGKCLDIDFSAVDVSDGAGCVIIRCRDEDSGVEVEQTFEVSGRACVCRSVVRNVGDLAFSVDWLASAMLPLPSTSGRIVSWRGRHNAELVECCEAMPQQSWVREVRRGISGHGGPGGVFVLDHGATLHQGTVRALQLAWSADNRVAIERDDEGCWIMSAGALLQPGEVTLSPGDSWTAPDAIFTVSTEGRNGAASAFHDAVRARLQWPGRTMRPRPVHLNSWEACYFDHDEARIVALAEAAASVGVERFILDDGWFRNRDDDTSGLGDWTADPRKYPNGLKPLADRVNALGMEFGLWVEPEMINPDSDLYRAHPDWALSLPGRPQPTARNQLVLDMARTDVRDYLFDCLDALLTELPITYLKWDHNRDLAPAGGAAQLRGVYALLARVRAAHPGVEVESCAGGGGRNDAGMAEFCHRYWTSDNIDAVSRISIQRGFLSFLPPEVMGSHIAASPAHATGRSHPLAFRAAMALTGHLGVEMDPRTLSEGERAELAGWISFYKQWRDLLHQGRVWLGEGADGILWQAQGKEDELLLFIIRAEPPADRRPQPLPLPFAAGGGWWDVQLMRIAGGEGGHAMQSAPLFEAMIAEPQKFSASWLAHSGLPLPPSKAETVSIFHMRKCA